jgi:hypothetical protein
MMKRYSSTMMAAITACLVAVAGASAAMASTGQVAGAHAEVSGGTWGTAQEVPGAAQLNEDGFANITSVACASAGNCSAGGYYLDGSHAQQAFVVNETNGTWHTAKEIPGTAALNQGRLAQLNSLSCATPGNCSAAGQYVDSSGHGQTFIVNQTKGTWRTAKQVPGTAALNQGGSAQAESVSCASPGNCSAGGQYTDSSGRTQVFVVKETNSTWRTAKEVRGFGALNKGLADLFSVSCGSPGNCSAGGSYTNASGKTQAFVVNQTNGSWGAVKQVPGLTGGSQADSVSCASAGNCSAGGFDDSQLFVVNETNSTWGTAEQIPGLTALNQSGQAELFSMSCASAGNCSTGGFYTDASGNTQAFVVNETNGTWHTAKEVPGTAALNSGGYASIYSISCASAGNCSAGGTYTDSSNHLQAFVVNETNGTWSGATEVPGTAELNQGGTAATGAVSCASAGNCSAGGNYTDSSNLSQAFVVKES